MQVVGTVTLTLTVVRSVWMTKVSQGVFGKRPSCKCHVFSQFLEFLSLQKPTHQVQILEIDGDGMDLTHREGPARKGGKAGVNASLAEAELYPDVRKEHRVLQIHQSAPIVEDNRTELTFDISARLTSNRTPVKSLSTTEGF